VHYSDDDDQTPRRGFAGDDDELVGPRRGGASRPRDEYDDEDLVGRRRVGQGARRSILDDDDGEDWAPIHRQSGPGRRGEDRERASLVGMVRDVPRYLKLLARLARDPRVSKVDKAIVAAVLVYLVSPVDLVPDWIVPVVGHVEDIYLLALALSRLVNNAGMDVLLDHWDGDPASLEAVVGLLDRAGALLPGPVRTLVGGRA
jgi:uncharacterized membrane protein YkvA (DUF1232 family)